MVEIPANDCTPADLFEWYKVQEELKKVKAREMILRMKVFKAFFPMPKEGTNTVELDKHPILAGTEPTGFVLKGTSVISREVDDAATTALLPELTKRKINVSDLIKRKPSLVVAEYRKLTEEEMQFFDQCLTIKPGSPSLEITLPAKRKTT